MQLTVQFEDDDVGTTTVCTDTSISMWNEMSADMPSILEGFRRALLAAGFGIESDAVVAIYNPSTQEVLY